jgi:hypothetical protein
MSLRTSNSIYIVKEYNHEYMSDSSLDKTLHEYLLILKQHLLFCKANSFKPLCANHMNLYVVALSNDRNITQKFPIYQEKYYLNLLTMEMIAEFPDGNKNVVYPSLLISTIIKEINTDYNFDDKNIVPIKTNQNIVPSKPIQPNKPTKIKPDNIKSVMQNVDVIVSSITTPNDFDKPLIQIEKKKPINNADIIDNSDSDSDVSSDNDDSCGYTEDELKAKLDELNNIKNDNIEHILDLKDKQDAEVDDYSSYLCDINGIKMKERMIVEKLEQQKRQYDGAKSTYNKIKRDLNLPVGKRPFNEDNIPILFADKYPIFKFMDDNNLFDTPNEFETFTEIYNTIDNTQTKETKESNIFIPHNLHYLDESKQEEYNKFISSTSKKHVPLDDLLKQQQELDQLELTSSTCATTNSNFTDHKLVNEISNNKLSIDDSQISKIAKFAQNKI